MTTPAWTNEQRAAIEHGGGALLLSAAAGSGKTAVLAARCAYLVCDAPEPCDVDQLLVLTFTRAAAAEMRERIDRAIRARVAEHPSPPDRWPEQPRLLDRAAISTLDSFCIDVVRSHFHLVGMDPAFSVLSPEDASLLRADAVRAVVEREFDGPRAGALRGLLDGYFDGDDAALAGELISAHAMLQSVTEPDAWVAAAIGRLDFGTPAAPSELARAYVAGLRRRIAGGMRELAGVAHAAQAEFPKYGVHAREIAEELRARDELLAAFDLDALAAHVLALKKLPTLPTIKEPPPHAVALKKRINRVKDAMKADGALRAPLLWTWAERAGDLRAVRETASDLFALVAEFGEQYARAKRALRSIDFADASRLALRILTDDPATLAPSGAATELQRRFHHVLVDESQDNSPIQDAIVRLVSTDAAAERGAASRSNLFAVGDVKQSVYRFRLAEPRQFVERLDRLRAPANGLGTVIDLQANFRSRPGLLEAINDVFERLMTRESADIDYDSTQALRSPGDYPPVGEPHFVGKPIELHVLPSKPARAEFGDGEGDEEEPQSADRFEREVAFVARRIRELICADAASRPRVAVRTADGIVDRPAEFGDIAVLLRSARFKASVVADQLRALGIPVHADDTTGFFNATEVQDLLSLVRVLSNRRQDVPLAAMLRSPLLAISDREATLASIRAAYPDYAFHHAVARYAAERDDAIAAELRHALATLDRWRLAIQERPIVEVLSQVLEETRYVTFCRALPEGEQRVANIDELLSRAAAFDAFERQGLDRFLRFLHELEAAGELGRPPAAVGETNLVRVMTVHKSKGLEFPIVIVPDLGKRFNTMGLGGPILLDRDAGIGIGGVDLRKRVRFDTAASIVVADRARRMMLAEEIRVLYVALTRAREHLILIGTADESAADAWADDWSAHHGPLPDEAVQSARTPLDWLGPIAAMTARRGLGTFDLRVGAPAAAEGSAAPGCASPDRRDAARGWIDAARRGDASGGADDAAVAEALDRLAFRYPHDEAAAQPATRAVTDDVEVTSSRHRPAPTPATAARLDWPEAYEPSARADAAEIGAATHRLLESLDFHAATDADAIRRQIDALVARRVLKRGDASIIDVAAVEWAVRSEAGDWMRAEAARVLREQPMAVAEAIARAASPGDAVLTRGRIDAMIVTEHDVVLIDYKTDRVTPEEAERRLDEYRPQLEGYAAAVSRLLGRPVTRALAVFLTPRLVFDALNRDEVAR